jgi:hypothetical protein
VSSEFLSFLARLANFGGSFHLFKVRTSTIIGVTVTLPLSLDSLCYHTRHLPAMYKEAFCSLMSRSPSRRDPSGIFVGIRTLVARGRYLIAVSVK